MEGLDILIPDIVPILGIFLSITGTDFCHFLSNSSGALQVSLMAASGGSVLALSRGCQQLLELSGLRPMWLPAIVPDLVLQKNHIKDR